METNLASLPAPARTEFRVFILYMDYAAGIRARRLIHGLRRLNDSVPAQFDLWKVDSISPPGTVRQLILHEAGEADVLVVAATGLDPRESAFEEWLERLAIWKAGRDFPGCLVGLLGDEAHPIEPAHWLCNDLAAFARQTRMHWSWFPGTAHPIELNAWLVNALPSDGNSLNRLTPCFVG
jgi:hypothetical protein